MLKREKRNNGRFRARYIGAALTAVPLITLFLSLSACASGPKTDLYLRVGTEGSTPDSTARLFPLGDRKIALEGILNGDGTLTVEYVEWFSNWRDGWTEARFFANGRVAIEGAGQNARLVALEPLIIQSAEKARVRYRDAILGGTEATALLDRRVLRAETAARALREYFGNRQFSRLRAEKKKDREESFEYAAGSYLFPERYGYPEGSAPSKKTKESRSRGEGLDWDTVYTASLDPRLTDVRDSGTLWRDWEECAELFYLLYLLE